MTSRMDAEERELFAKSLRHATTTMSGAALDVALLDLGWREAFAADRRTAVSSLFEQQGAAGATSSALDWVVADALGVDAAVVLPPLGRCDPPGRLDGGTLDARGLATAGLGQRRTAVVVASSGVDVVAAVFDTTDLAQRPIDGLDPWLGLIEVAGDRQRVPTPPAPPPAAWATAVAAAQVAIAHELVGVSRTMLELAREHALERVQFGRPIASFQAVRHRLAESLVAIEGAAAALDAAWDALWPLGATVAKAVAGRSARIVARHAQQVLAGIGFTTEHSLHRYVKRSMVLDRLFGDSRTLTRQLGEDLLRARALPAVLPL